MAYNCFRIALNSLVVGPIFEEFIALSFPISSRVLMSVALLISGLFLLEAGLFVVELAPGVLVLRLYVIIALVFHVLLKTRIYMLSFKV